jgi:hypothetical protein
MGRSKPNRRSPASRPAATARVADQRVEADARLGSIGVDAAPRFPRDLVPVFMMLDSEVLRRLNEKAAALRTGYDLLLRAVLRDHIDKYLRVAPTDVRPPRSAPRTKGR